MSSSPALLIDGARSGSAAGAVYDVDNPATGQHLATVPAATEADVARAAAAARRAAPGWAGRSPEDRAELLTALADRLEEHLDELADIDCVDLGRPIGPARRDVEIGIQRLRYFAGLATELRGSTHAAADGKLVLSTRRPYGPVGIIVPFNHPALFTIGKMGSALVAGNTVVLKAAEQAPLSALRIGEIAEDALPAGVLNILSGGRETGKAIVDHPDVLRVSFTGSVAAGIDVLSRASRKLMPALLELGGKNAMVVLPDADLEAVVRGAVVGMALSSCGQSCQSATRFFVHESRHDDFVARMATALDRVVVGDPRDAATGMGPLVTAQQRSRVMGYVEAAQAEGAELVAGGKAPDLPEPLRGGYFVSPVLFGGVKPDMALAREEIFGPVGAVFRWRDPEQMLGEVNGVDYGMTASVWGHGLEALELCRRIEAGYVYVNQHGGTAHGVPFGGWKRSGIGVEHSIEEMHDWTRVQTIDAVLRQ